MAEVLPGARRVLIVDDNVDAANTLAEVVETAGNQVRVAHDGESAIATAAAWSPDIVLLDISLPGMDGYEVARKLRSTKAPARLIALTGFSEREHRVRALEAGFDKHLVKPIDLDQLTAALDS